MVITVAHGMARKSRPSASDPSATQEPPWQLGREQVTEQAEISTKFMAFPGHTAGRNIAGHSPDDFSDSLL